MFERYTEKARRAIFFARYEASQFGLQFIDANCLLIGLVRENGQISTRWLALDATELHSLVESQTIKSKPVSTSVDMPLTNELKRVLAHTAEEAERLAHRNIDTEHLFLGLLREPETFAARRIKERGLTPEQIRAALAQDSSGHEPKEDAQCRSVHRDLRVKVLDESGEELDIEELATLLWTARPPSIGEAILVKDAGALERYRIVDVLWSVQNKNAVSQPAEIVLKVRKEQS
jgi:ATP-dependent Clp protease ATP-binding subunit ClpC